MFPTRRRCCRSGSQWAYSGDATVRLVSPAGDRSFTVRGMRNGSSVHVTWHEGKLSGDPPTVDLVVIEAEMSPVYRADPALGRAHAELHSGLADEPLTDPESAYRLIASVMDRVQGATGDVPSDGAG